MGYYDMTVGIIATIVFTALLLVIYKFVVNPQKVISSESLQTTCPDSWKYNIGTKMCEPTGLTHCTPFDPSAQTLQSAAAKCNVAQSCGTFWPGYCPS
jgi:hypothetical protein